MGLRGKRRVSARHCRPSPFLSSSSTELTFKLWHQLPCQTRCDFPLLHLPSLLLVQFLLLLLSPPSFPLTPSLSSNGTATCSGVPIHSMPALQEALQQVGIAGLTLAALLPRPALGHCGSQNHICKVPLCLPSGGTANLPTSPSRLPAVQWGSFCSLLQLPQPHPSQKPQAGMYPPFNVHLHLAPGLKDIFCLPL